MDWQARISVERKAFVGKPVIKRTRNSGEILVGLLPSRWTPARILKNYPHRMPTRLQAALRHAAEPVKQAPSHPL